jgi:hypothetical protein
MPAGLFMQNLYVAKFLSFLVIFNITLITPTSRSKREPEKEAKKAAADGGKLMERGALA